MRKAAALLIVLAVLAGAWSAAWFAAAAFAGREVDRAIAAEARRGREWTCPDRHVEGYPFAVAVTCRDATYAGQAMGQRVEGQAAGVSATLSLAHPTHVAIVIAPPFSYRSSDGQTAVGGTWKSLMLDVSALPDPRALALHGTDVVVHGRFPGQDEAGGHAATIAARLIASPPRPDRTLDFSVAMTGTPMPILDDLIGGSAPVDAAFAGRLDQADPGEARTPEEAMEAWRQNGGTVWLSDVKVSRGGASVTASGVIGLDDQHRPRGKLDASFVGLEPILKRYGISGNVAALGSLIGTLFGGGKPVKPAAPGALALPISFGNGRLGIGPITTAVKLSPLY